MTGNSCSLVRDWSMAYSLKGGLDVIEESELGRDKL